MANLNGRPSSPRRSNLEASPLMRPTSSHLQAQLGAQFETRSTHSVPLSTHSRIGEPSGAASANSIQLDGRPSVEVQHQTVPDITRSVQCEINGFQSTESGVAWNSKNFWLSEILNLREPPKVVAEAWDIQSANPEYQKGEKFRWIHLPANNRIWAQATIQRIRSRLIHGTFEAGHIGVRYLDHFCSEDFFAERSNDQDKGPYHTRFKTPFCQTWKEELYHGRTEMVYMMPFLHWERVLHYEKMRGVVQEIQKYGLNPNTYPAIPLLSGPKTNDEVEELLLRQYLPGNAVNIRRSLDQSYYSTMEDTTSRDCDQVIDKYAKNYRSISDKVRRPMIMVDQLWLWLLDDNTILTCFPHTWTHDGPLSDPIDLFGEIKKYLGSKKNRNGINTAKKLAYLIIDRCAGNIVDRLLTNHHDYQFIDHFDKYIDILMEEQRECLEDLNNAITESAKEGPEDIHKSSFNIESEFQILKAIRDIQEELQMLIHIVEQQQEALNSLMHQSRDHSQKSDSDSISLPGLSVHTVFTTAKQIKSKTIEDGISEHSHSQSKDEASRRQREILVPIEIQSEKQKIPTYLLLRSKKREDILRSLLEKAQRTDKSIDRLMDLKQQQANVLEARWSRLSAEKMRRIAEESEKQSNQIMLFTVVTILFLPLSTIAGIFGVNAHEFGQGEVPLSFIMQILFPVSVGCIFLTFFLAFNDRIRRILLLIFRIFWVPISMLLPDKPLDWLENSLKAILDKIQNPRPKTRTRPPPKPTVTEVHTVEVVTTGHQSEAHGSDRLSSFRPYLRATKNRNRPASDSRHDIRSGHFRNDLEMNIKLNTLPMRETLTS